MKMNKSYYGLEEIFAIMGINGDDISYLDANGWLYLSLRFYEKTGIILDIGNLDDDCLKKKNKLLTYITSLSERSETKQPKMYLNTAKTEKA